MSLPQLSRIVIQLSDDWYQAEPLGYLVGNYDTTVREYEVFAVSHAATKHADRQYEAARKGGDPGMEFPVYTLYVGAGKPFEVTP